MSEQQGNQVEDTTQQPVQESTTESPETVETSEEDEAASEQPEITTTVIMIGGDAETVTGPAGMTVADVLEELDLPDESQKYTPMINGEPVEPSHALQADTKLMIVMNVRGGIC